MAMRILIVAHKVPYPPCGGATERNYNLLKECSQSHRIHLITFTQEPYLRDPERLRASIEHLRRYCEEVRVFRIPTDGKRLRWLLLLFFNLFSPAPYSAWRFRSGEMAAAISESLRLHKFDIMEIGTIALLKYSDLAPNLPKLLVHHNIESVLLGLRSRHEKNPLTKLYLALQARKLRRLEKQAGRKIRHHTTVSELDKRILLEICPGIEVSVVDNGTDLDYFRPSDLPVKPDSLIFVGEMSWYANAQAMIFFYKEIMPILRREVSELEMNLVGANPPRELIDYGNRDPQFMVRGFVDDIRQYVHSAAVFVVPLKIGGGTRLKILDALAMGKAVVSTSVGCEGLHLKEDEDIFVADDPVDFAGKILMLLKDNNLRKRVEMSARKTVEERYSWEKIAGRLNKTYTKASAGNTGQVA
jgi:glycosyltransferase involved in cell wall biosynthesis